MGAGGYRRIAPAVLLGRDVKIYAFINLYGCEIGDDCKIGTFVELTDEEIHAVDDAVANSTQR